MSKNKIKKNNNGLKIKQCTKYNTPHFYKMVA